MKPEKANHDLTSKLTGLPNNVGNKMEEGLHAIGINTPKKSNTICTHLSNLR
ncbi:hypothetical protein KRX19_04810 [Cardiobacteriaceae bacterium TAE3-ERU3]|nr:hypothetical protein [Cardiobacteriaceae bacterium TAE3-ERU3]